MCGSGRGLDRIGCPLQGGCRSNWVPLQGVSRSNLVPSSDSPEPPHSRQYSSHLSTRHSSAAPARKNKTKTNVGEFRNSQTFGEMEETKRPQKWLAARKRTRNGHMEPFLHVGQIEQPTREKGPKVCHMKINKCECET